MELFVFPRWTNKIRQLAGVALGVGPLFLVGFAYYGGHPRTTEVGYMPEQPVPYSHALHAGELGIDCRYCHNTVEKAAHAAIPPTQTCMNCHKNNGGVHTKSNKLLPIRESYATGDSVKWTKVHDLPDYVYFNHSAHVTRGVGCVECHGRVDQMVEVYNVKTLTMAWCLECHRAPESHLRPPELVTKMDWKPPNDPNYGATLRAKYQINPPEDCSTCHR